MQKDTSSSIGRTLTTELSDDKKKAIWTFTANPNEELQTYFNISYKIGLKKPISNELVFKATLIQGGVEIDDNTKKVKFIALDESNPSASSLLGSIYVNKDSITLKNLNDVLTDKVLVVDYTCMNLDSTNTSDIVLTIEITN